MNIVDLGHLQRLLDRHRRQDRGHRARQQRLAGAGRAGHQDVMCTIHQAITCCPPAWCSIDHLLRQKSGRLASPPRRRNDRPDPATVEAVLCVSCDWRRRAFPKSASCHAETRWSRSILLITPLAATAVALACTKRKPWFTKARAFCVTILSVPYRKAVTSSSVVALGRVNSPTTTTWAAFLALPSEHLAVPRSLLRK